MQKNNIQPDPEKLQYIVDCLSTEELLAQRGRGRFLFLRRKERQ